MSRFQLKACSSLLPSLLSPSYSSSSLLFPSRFVLGNQRPAFYASAIPTPTLDAKKRRTPAPKKPNEPSKVSCKWNDEHKYTLGELRKSKDVFQRTNKLVQMASSVDTLPKETTLQFAIMGSSNVGKSTLINRLTKTKLARVSSYPKRTKTVNFYSINSGKLFLVDFPGYQPGAATGKSAEKEEFIYHYLSTRKSLKALVLLDSRKGVEINDLDLLTYLEDNNIKHQVILAKADLVGQAEFDKKVEAVKELLQTHNFADKTVLYFANTDKNTSDLIRAKLVEYGKFAHVKEKPLKVKKEASQTDFHTLRDEFMRIYDEKNQQEKDQNLEDKKDSFFKPSKGSRR